MRAKLRTMREERGDRGFTLIELLVVVVIIGVLVAIAIPVYLNYRKGAENKSAESDARNAVPAIEQCYNDSGNKYPASVAAQDTPIVLLCPDAANKQTLNVSTGNKITYTNNADGTFTVAVQNSDTSNTYTYNSSTAKISKS